MKQQFFIHAVSIFFLLLSGSFFFSSIVEASDQDVVVNEAMYDFPDADSGHEWVELYNSSDAPVTVIGGSGATAWRIYDGSNHTISTTPSQGSLTMSGKSYLIVAQHVATFLADNAGFSGNLVESSALNLGNSSGLIELKIGSSGSPWGTFSYTNSFGADGDGTSLQKQGGQVIAASATPGRENESQAATPTLTPTSVPTNTPTPVKTPTPTPTPKPTVTNTPTPTGVKNATPTPTVKTTLTPYPTPKTTITQTTSPSGRSSDTRTLVLGKSDSNDIQPSPHDSNSQQVDTTLFSKMAIVLGGVLLITCGILLLFRLENVSDIFDLWKKQ